MKAITQKRISNLLLAFFLIAIIYVLTFTVSCTSCSQSGKRISTLPKEKVVIIDSYLSNKTGDITMYKYKVKRIQHGVIDVIYEYNLYGKGDTIYHRF